MSETFADPEVRASIIMGGELAGYIVHDAHGHIYTDILDIVQVYKSFDEIIETNKEKMFYISEVRLYDTP